MKYIMYLIGFVILYISFIPLGMMLIVATLFTFESKYINLGDEIMRKMWDFVFSK